MTDFLLIFLAAAYVNNLLLIAFFDRAIDASVRHVDGVSIFAGLVLTVITGLHTMLPSSWAPPSQAKAFLLALAFTTTVLAIAKSSDIAPRLVRPGLFLLRKHLPLLVANLAVLLFAVLDRSPAIALPATLGFCVVASLAFQLALVLASDLHDRIDMAAVPRILRGEPITILTAGLMALALTGAIGSVPW